MKNTTGKNVFWDAKSRTHSLPHADRTDTSLHLHLQPHSSHLNTFKNKSIHGKEELLSVLKYCFPTDLPVPGRKKTRKLIFVGPMGEMLTSITGSYLTSQRVDLNWALIVSRIERNTFPGFLSSRVYITSSFNPLNSQTNIPLPTDEKTEHKG